jgi:mannose-6-phosphate isomerase-like protein (cupin superfamily)
MIRKSFVPLDLFDNLIQLREGGGAELSARPGVSDAGLWTMAAIHANDSTALHSDVWERHPSGNEVLCVLSGAVNVYFRDHGDAPVATVTAGQAVIVPIGQWHRLTVSEPASLLAITPRAETQHERVQYDETGSQG